MTDAQQFEVFMRNYQDMVFSTAMRLLASEAEAEDIAQEVFLKAYERFDELHDDPKSGGWLKTVTTNLCLNHLSRYRFRWKFFSELANDSEEFDAPIDLPAENTGIDELEKRDRAMMVDEALRKLPAAQRVPLVLYHLEGFSYEEIAERLEVSLAKVKTDIFRGREALRRRLQRSAGGTELI